MRLNCSSWRIKVSGTTLNCVLTAGPTWTGTRACSSHLYYVEDWRTALDIRILAKTPSAVLRGAETH
jgi:lipopolysaccharide/colanic/teichoic acid biosynthesis glycosyltransferase